MKLRLNFQLRVLGFYLACILLGILIAEEPGPALLALAYLALLKGIVHYATKPLEE